MPRTKEKPQSEEKNSPLSVGLQCAQRITAASLQVVVLVYLGYWVDRYFGTTPWGVLGFSVLGMASMFYSFLRIAYEFGKNPTGSTRKSDEK